MLQKFLYLFLERKNRKYFRIFGTLQNYTKKNQNTLKTTIKKTHPYDVPEIAEINVSSINKPYLKWMIESTI